MKQLQTDLWLTLEASQEEEEEEVVEQAKWVPV